MNVFYLVCTVLGGVSLIAAMILLFVFELKIDRQFFDIKGKTIPIEEFVPRSINSFLLFLFSFGTCGLVLGNFPIGWYFSVPFSIVFGFIINFLFVHFLRPFIKNLAHGAFPKGDKLSGFSGICVDFIAGDGYGRIKLDYNGNIRYVNAVSANETDIDEGDEVLVVIEQDGVCIVEKADEIYDVFKEDDSHVY